MLFTKDGIPSIFGRDNTIGTFPEADLMITPGQKDVNYDPGSVKKDFEGAGILDNSETEEKFGGIDDRGAEFNFSIVTYKYDDIHDCPWPDCNLHWDLVVLLHT